MKTFLTLPIILMFLLSYAVTSDDNKRNIIIEKCFKPTVLIESTKSPASGTGFITNSTKIEPIDCYCNIVFSCEHILKSKDLLIKCSDFDVDGIFTNYQTYKGEVAVVDGENDLSLIYFLSPKKMPCAELNQGYKPKVCDELLAIGHGLGETSRFSEGKMTGVIRSETTKQILSYKTSVSIIFGDSGGPLFHENKVIGIANSMRNVDIAESKHPIYNISFYKPLGLMSGILKNNFIKNDKFQEVHPPEILSMMLWSKSLEIVD